MYELLEAGPFRTPTMVAAFDGWVNAGSAGTGAAEYLVGAGPVVATFDVDRLFDYRDVRPTIDFADGVMGEVSWPEVRLFCRHTPDRDVLVLTGSEPSLGWAEFSRSVAGLASDLGVERHVSLGGIPWAVPHTRPVSVITTASAGEGLADGEERLGGSMVVPASVTSVVERAIADTGVPTTGLWARVPNYVGTPLIAAAQALVERVSDLFDLDLDTADLATAAAEQRVELDAIAAARPEVAQMITQLETMIDDAEVPSGDQLAAEIEHFLRRRDDDD